MKKIILRILLIVLCVLAVLTVMHVIVNWESIREGLKTLHGG